MSPSPIRRARDSRAVEILESARPIASRGAVAHELGPAGRSRGAGQVEQVLHAAHAGDALRDGLDARDVLLALDYPAQEYGAVLGVDVDEPLRDAGAAE